MNEASPTPSPGLPAEIAGRYRVLGRLGAGGMGIVYRAEHVLSKKRVAVKVLFPHLCQGAQAVERFRREVSAAAEIDHPGIVQVFDAGMDEAGGFYMAMELLEGESLAGLLRREWPTSRRAVALVRELLGPLARAHERSFVHRDLKPENVFLARDPASGEVRVKLLDFGLARELTTKGPTLTGITFGTPEYMSPEQAMSARNAGTPADVWSVGVILYELLSGHLPFDGETPNAVMVSAIKDPHVPLRERARELPPALAQVVERCLDKDAASRPATAGALAALIDAALAEVSLDDTRPATTHLDARREAAAAAVGREETADLAGIPRGGAETVLGLRGAPTEADRPSTTVARSASTAWLGAAALGALAVVGLAATVATRGGAAGAVRATPLAPASSPPVAAPLSAAPATAEPLPAEGPTPSPPALALAEDVPPTAPEPPASAEPIEAAAPAARAPVVARSADTAGTSAAATTPSAEAAGLDEARYAEAQACVVRGDRACAIEILRTSRRARDLARVIDLYGAEGRTREALAAMQSFVRRFPRADETPGYRDELARHGL